MLLVATYNIHIKAPSRKRSGEKKSASSPINDQYVGYKNKGEVLFLYCTIVTVSKSWLDNNCLW